MSNENAIPESHIRLVATPTAGVPAEHSPYYRRLVSAGYKGYLQGNIAGASLYGAIGAGVGVIAALVIGVATGTAPILVCSAVFGGYGLLKGSTTFGQIGSNAAQLAEYAEMNERRNALLDRLYETPSKDEANEIRKLLQSDSLDKPPTKLLHFRTALIGAIIGAVILAAVVTAAFNPMLVGTELANSAIHFIGPLVGETLIKGGALATGALPALVGMAAAVGAALGSMIGIDRGWIRRWFDLSEGAVHERDYYDKIAQERAQEVSRLHRIGQNEMREMANGIAQSEMPVKTAAAAPTPLESTAPAPINAQDYMIKSDVPMPKIAANDIEDKGRLQELQRAAASV